ncbi:hypothetical protein AURDEDRAFT_154938, partial [Auricularia subglabra TFB-10046 SS5]
MVLLPKDRILPFTLPVERIHTQRCAGVQYHGGTVVSRERSTATDVSSFADSRRWYAALDTAGLLSHCNGWRARRHRTEHVSSAVRGSHTRSRRQEGLPARRGRRTRRRALLPHRLRYCLGPLVLAAPAPAHARAARAMGLPGFPAETDVRRRHGRDAHHAHHPHDAPAVRQRRRGGPQPVRAPRGRAGARPVHRRPDAATGDDGRADLSHVRL